MEASRRSCGRPWGVANVMLLGTPAREDSHVACSKTRRLGMHVRSFGRSLVAAALPLLASLASGARAQDNPELGDVGHASHDASSGHQWGPAPKPHGDHAGHGSGDHAGVVGKLGLGYFGRQQFLAGTDENPLELDVPALGIRYWTSDKLAIEAALGFANSGITMELGGVKQEMSATVFLLHSAVPVVLGAYKHLVFELIPELNLGFLSGSGGPMTDLGGFLLQVGGRVGAEMHFGFVDLPSLSLQATAGLHYASLTATAESMGSEASVKQSFLGTGVGAASSLAVIYYFAM